MASKNKSTVKINNEVCLMKDNKVIVGTKRILKNIKDLGQKKANQIQVKSLDIIKQYYKPFLIIFAVYCLSMLTIWLANYNYTDDYGRAIFGYAWSQDFNRYTQTILGRLLSFKGVLYDISPIPQILAMAFMAIATIILAYSLNNNKKPGKVPLLGATLICLAPYMMGCWIYKFDAPGMALSILASVIPMLWWHIFNGGFKDRKSWLVTIGSSLAILIMLTSYQASSGVFPVAILALALRSYIDKNEKFIVILKKICLMILSYAIALAIFKFIIPNHLGTSYRSIDIFTLNNIIQGSYHNYITMITFSWHILAHIWKVLILTLVGSLVFAVSLKGYKVSINRIIINNIALGLFLVLGSIVSYGLYLLLVDPPWYLTRSLVGIGFLMGVIAYLSLTLLQNHWRLLAALPVAALVYSFMAFNWGVGNAVADQDRYANNYNSLLASQIADIYGDKDTKGRSITIYGTIGKSAVMKHFSDIYTIADPSLIVAYGTGLDEHSFWGYVRINLGMRLLMHPKLNNDKITDTQKCSKKIRENHYFIFRKDKDDNLCVTIKPLSMPPSIN